MHGDEALILAANDAFYGAFARRDVDAMETLWARNIAVACIHPGWEVLRGRGEVMASFHAILASPNAPPIKADHAQVTLLGGDVAIVVCTESIDGTELVATNLFVREDGSWKLAHHQAGPIARRSAPPRRTPPTVLN
ncbi:nuclear transport factor 2 family protein [Polyangium aurulentum]|uniref:nuclear transport factor 2 family protein n=1 Tax=Polyangium aurulentum TaxID=2567896 RepID=UPI0010AE71A6|nr:nuclear transport factor 2 family protein [Polyangium aurulentum]UQA54655.1 nuclear transport factor 2 family protein [Polyangium aurulentum]